MNKPIVIMFGGVSPEHEVSVISGLQVVESIDRAVYQPHVVYITKQGELQYLDGLTNRKQFLSAKRKSIDFGRDSKGGYLEIPGLRSNRIYPYAAYLAFHGGLGEGGGIQGLLESLGIAYTSTTQESAVITMNKQLTKEQVAKVGIGVVEGVSIFASDIRTDSEKQAKLIEQKLGLPVIIKPVHLGSSIGIKIAKSGVELEKYLLEAAFVDREILIEKYLTGFTEYNCAVRLVSGELEASEVERPLSHDEILSFADKYQRGGKKTMPDGRQAGENGMASLQRELPANISAELRTQVQEAAKKAFIACRCKGMVRIDFMQTQEGKLLLTEINPIPGSMAFYLWEASGIPFKQQITDLIEQAVQDNTTQINQSLDYTTDIVQKFIGQSK